MGRRGLVCALWPVLVGEAVEESASMKPTKATLEAMLRCSEEWVEFWERRALVAEQRGERYTIPEPKQLRRARR